MKKRRITARALAFSRGIAPTKERSRQEGGIVEEAINERSEGRTYTRRYKATFASSLEVYLQHGMIGHFEYEIGQKFAREYSRSVLKVSMSDHGSGSHGDPEMRAISAINANELLRKAFAVLSPPRRELVISVCVESHPARSMQRIRSLIISLRLIAEEWRAL